jgi:hypothetical protein
VAASVYILVHRSGERFKIGKALNVLSRIKAFGISTLDLGRSEVLEVKDGADAYNLERALHRTFRRWRIPAQEILAAGGAEDGASEWFRTECTERLNQFLNANRDLFRFERRALKDPEELAAWLACGDNDEERVQVVNMVGAQVDLQSDWDGRFDSDQFQENDAPVGAAEDGALKLDADRSRTDRAAVRHFEDEALPIADFGKKLLAAERLVGKAYLSKLRALCTNLVLLPQGATQAAGLRTLCGEFEANHRQEIDALLVELESEYRPFHFIEGVFAASEWELLVKSRELGLQSTALKYAAVVVVLRWPAAVDVQSLTPPGVHVQAQPDPLAESLKQVAAWQLKIEGWDIPLGANPAELLRLQEKAIAEISGQPNFKM